MNWEKARREAKREAPPVHVYVRQAEKSDQWMKRYMKYSGICENCGEEVIVGERAFMRKNPSAPPRWLFLHEACKT